MCRPACPASDPALAHFVAYLADVIRVAPSTIKVYLSAVRSLHIDQGWSDPLDTTPMTQRVLAGVKRVHGMHSRLHRLPITGRVLQQLVASFRSASWLSATDRLMLTAAATLAFHAFLRCSELTTGLTRRSMTVHNQPQPHLEFVLPASKTDPFRRGATIAIGRCAGPCCAVAAVSAYLQATAGRSPDGPLFQFTSGMQLSRLTFTQSLQHALADAAVPQASAYKGHSFRIGAATTAAQAGVPAWLIKTMGRWSSDAYMVYIRTPLEMRLAVASRLTGGY